MKKKLVKLANHLDRIGLRKEADYIDALLKKEALFSWSRYFDRKVKEVLAAAGTPISNAVIKYGVECAEELTTIFPIPHIPDSDEISECVVKKLEENAIDIAIDTVKSTCDAIYKVLKDLMGM